jgi:hypothetical protein
MEVELRDGGTLGQRRCRVRRAQDDLPEAPGKPVSPSASAPAGTAPTAQAEAIVAYRTKNGRYRREESVHRFLSEPCGADAVD